MLYQLLRGTAASLAERVKTAKGEFTVVVAPLEPDVDTPTEILDADIAMAFDQLANSAAKSHGEAVAATAKRLGMPRRLVYAALERTKVSGK